MLPMQKQRVGSKRWITVVDAKSGYWATPVKPEDRWLTAFVYNNGLYRFRRTPFGLKSSATTFARALKKILKPVKDFTDSNVDDIATFPDEWRQHLLHLEQFLQTVSRAHITSNIKKCKFAVSCQILWRDHRIGAEENGFRENRLLRKFRLRPIKQS